MQTEPLTGARKPEQSDGPLGGLQISNAIDDLAPLTVAPFNTVADRDAAFSFWVANGHAMRDLLRCSVSGVGDQVYLSGAWVTVGGTVPYPRPFGFLLGSGTQTVATGTAAALFLNLQQRLTNMTATLSGGILRASVPGWYLVSGGVSFPANSGGTRRMSSILKNGTQVTGSVNSAFVSGPVNLWVATPAVPVALNGTTDTVQLAATQDTGADLVVDRTDCFLQMHWLGPLTP